MEAVIAIVVILSVLSLAGFGIWYSYYAARMRREAFLETANSMGLSYSADGNPDLLNQLSDFKLFNQGRARTMVNLIEGDSGEVKIAIFDYRYTTGSNKESKTHHQSVVALQSPALNCPDFTMRPENFLDKIGGALGFQDIDFETHPNFSNSFVLKGSDEAAIRKYFKPELLDFFEARTGISVEAVPGKMFFYRAGKRIKPDETKDHLAQAYEVFGVMIDQS